MNLACNHKIWRKDDFLKVIDGKRYVNAIKLTHPFRKQQVLVFPFSSVAKKEFFEEWIYKPYALTSRIFISLNLINPVYSWPRKLIIKRKKYSEYTVFDSLSFPTMVDLNLTRVEFSRRHKILMQSPFLQLLPQKWNELFTQGLARRIRSIIGDRYFFHPKNEESSFVFFITTKQMPACLNTLTKLGFEVIEETSIHVGDEADLNYIENSSQVWQSVAYGYFWSILLIFLINESRRCAEDYRNFREKKILESGEDSKKYGF